jgi:hypothetical protein
MTLNGEFWELGAAEMSKRFHYEGGDLYLPAVE